MKHILANKTKMLFAAGCALAVLTTGCIREDLDACATHKLTVKVVNVNGEEITGAGRDVQEAAVFLFDENYNHLSTVKLSKEDVMGYRKIDLNYPVGKKIYAVAWGNAYMGKQDVNEGQLIDQLKVALKTKSDIANSPDSLFHGNRDVLMTATEVEVVDTVTIWPKVGYVKMYTEGLPYALQKANLLKAGTLKADVQVEGCDLSLERTLSVYDYEGNLEGNSVYYTPGGKFTPDYEWTTEVYNNYATGTDITARIDVAGIITQAQAQDTDNKPLSVEAGKGKDVIFQWGPDGNFIGIKVIVRPWGYIPDDIIW